MNDLERVENFDRKRRRYYRGYVFAFAVFIVICSVRFVFRLGQPMPSWLDWTLTSALFLTLVVQIYFIVRLGKMKKQAKRDPELKGIMEDELTKHHGMRAWKYGFFSMVICLGILAIISAFIVPIHDTMGLIFTTLWAGLGGYHLSFAYMEKD